VCANGRHFIATKGYVACAKDAHGVVGIGNLIVSIAYVAVKRDGHQRKLIASRVANSCVLERPTALGYSRTNIHFFHFQKFCLAAANGILRAAARTRPARTRRRVCACHLLKINSTRLQSHKYPTVFLCRTFCRVVTMALEVLPQGPLAGLCMATCGICTGAAHALHNPAGGSCCRRSMLWSFVDA
jgi:hypothetical protein